MNARPAQASDLEGLVQLWERSVRASHSFLKAEDVAALRPLVANELASAEIEWWVLVGDNAEHPIGFLGMTSGTIEGLFIDPGHHRRGAGRFLVDHAQRLHPGALAVDVNEQNEAALRFYEALGFSVVRRSAQDGDGRPFPILHMQRPAPALHD